MKEYLDYNTKLKNSLYWPLIKRFSETTIERLKDKILAIVVFGSVARGTTRKDSDIDILILLESKEKPVLGKLLKINIDSYNWSENQRFLEEDIYTKIFAIKETERELRDNPLILLDILDHGVILYDPQDKLENLLSDLDKKLKSLGAKKIVFSDGKWCWDLKPDWKPGEVVEIKL